MPPRLPLGRSLKPINNSYGDFAFDTNEMFSIATKKK